MKSEWAWRHNFTLDIDFRNHFKSQKANQKFTLTPSILILENHDHPKNNYRQNSAFREYRHLSLFCTVDFGKSLDNATTRYCAGAGR